MAINSIVNHKYAPYACAPICFVGGYLAGKLFLEVTRITSERLGFSNPFLSGKKDYQTFAQSNNKDLSDRAKRQKLSADQMMGRKTFIYAIHISLSSAAYRFS